MNSSLTGWFQFPSLRLALAAIALAAAAAYLPILRAEFIWDDAEYVTANPAVLEADGIGRIWTDPDSCPYYYPTTFTAFWLQCRFWGVHPLGYHLVNVGLHILNACLLVLILLRLNIPCAFLGGLIFALHPVQSASVAWVTELKNVLSETFYLLALLFWLRGRSRMGIDYFFAVLLFLFGMLAKPVICSFPVILCLLIWRRPEGRPGGDLWKTSPFFAIALAVSLFTLFWESGKKIAVDPLYDLSLPDRILLSGQSLAFYLGKLVWPHPLAAVYPRWEIGTASLIPWIIPVGIGILIVGLWTARRRTGKGPLIALLGIALTLGPLLGVFNFSGMVYSYVYTHHLYHSTPFFAALVCGLFGWRLERASNVAVKVEGALVLILLTAYAVVTWRQAVIHENGRTLFEHSVAAYPTNPQAWVFLGNHLLEEGQYDAAIEHYEAAIRLAPLDPQAHFGMAEAFVKLGNADRVLEHLQKSVEGGPTYSAARFNLAWAYRNRGDQERAVEHFSELIRFRPSYWSAYIPLAESLLELGREEEAEAVLEAALEIRPDFADAEHRLALMLLDCDEVDRAIEHFEKSLALDPDRGVQFKPEFARRLVEKARILRDQGRNDRADRLVEEARRIWPRLPELNDQGGDS